MFIAFTGSLTSLLQNLENFILFLEQKQYLKNIYTATTTQSFFVGTFLF